MRASKTPSVPALSRGLAILERIAKSRRGLTFAQLTRHFGFPKSSVHTLLLTFEREGYLQRDPATGRYMTGMKLVNIASMTIDGVVLRDKAAPLLQALAAETAMTAHLAVLDREEVAVVAKVERPGRERVATWIGKRVDVHCTSLGKSLLAYLPDEEVDRLIGERGLLRHNENTIVSPLRLKEELARTRAVGYAMDNEEEEIGMRCIGAPDLELGRPRRRRRERDRQHPRHHRRHVRADCRAGEADRARHLAPARVQRRGRARIAAAQAHGHDAAGDGEGRDPGSGSGIRDR